MRGVSRLPVGLPAFVALLLMVSSFGCGESGVDGATVIHSTVGGLDLSGTYLRSDSSTRGPTMLLLHETGPTHSRFDFDPIWETLAQAGYNLVAPDLRSHGLSEAGGTHEELAYSSDGYPEDVRGWLQFIADRADAGDPLDRDRVGILGLGSSASIAAAALGKEYVGCAVAVSPSIAEINAFEDGFLRPGEIADALDGPPEPDAIIELSEDVSLHTTRWMVSVGDEPSATDGPVLHAATEEPSSLYEESGAFHGTELLMLSEDNRRAMVEWCLDKL